MTIYRYRYIYIDIDMSYSFMKQIEHSYKAAKYREKVDCIYRHR